jgi:hemoglobin
MQRFVQSRFQVLSCLLGAVFAVALSACSGGQVRPVDNVYEQLGGKSGIEDLTTALLDRVYADDRIAFLFEDANREDLHGLIVEQICMETGGPCEYTGLPMDEGHSGLGIKHSEFDAFVEDLILAMEDTGIPYRTQNRVLRIFAPMRDDIVYK